MPAFAFALVLIGALIHAGWNIVAKKAGGDSRFTFFSGILMAIFWAPLALWMGWDVLGHWGWRAWTLVGVSGFVHWVYFVCLLTGYRTSDLTVVYPMARGSGPRRSLSPAAYVGELFAALIGGQLLGEGDRLARILGAMAIAAGVMALAWG